MGRIVEYDHLSHKLRKALHERFPGGIKEEDIIHFETPKEGWVSAVELHDDQETYLVKYSLSTREKLEEYTIEDIDPPQDLQEESEESEDQ
jgi:hypothetical protein